MSDKAKNVSNDILDRKIEYWKSELLDTGKRNKMINYRETKRTTLRILEPEASILFNTLAFSDKQLSFQKPIDKDTDLRTYSMIALMETLSYNLNVQVGDIKTDGTIIDREKTLKNLRSKAKLAQEEQGTNILYLSFGFIYWREKNRESSPWLKAPLLVMPVTLGLKSLRSPFTLTRYDDEIVVNPTLDYYFSTEYNIKLPEFSLTDKNSLDEYFEQVESIVDQSGWKLTREVSLGLLSFLKISMYHDLDDNNDLLITNQVLRAMSGDKDALGELPAEAIHYDFDSTKPGEWHQVIDSDSSQDEAILLSKLGVSFVMQGPPGTGKSQTITNIISEAMADGKKILFVSEKAAALQVVLKRLTEVHLDDFCLALHNYKANKKEIIESIGANLSLNIESNDLIDSRELTELFHDRSFLDKYAKELHKIIEPMHKSIYAVFGIISALEQRTSVDFNISDPLTITDSECADLLYHVSAFEKALHNMGGHLSNNPWNGTRAASFDQSYKKSLIRQTENLSENLRKTEKMSEKINSILCINGIISFNDVKMLTEVSLILLSRPDYISPIWFDKNILNKGKAIMPEAKAHSDSYHEIKEKMLTVWDKSVLSVDAEDLDRLFGGSYSQTFSNASNKTLLQVLTNQQTFAKSLLNKIANLIRTYHNALEMLNYEQNDSISGIKMISKVLSLTADSPHFDRIWFDLRKQATLIPLAEKALIHKNEYDNCMGSLESDWEDSIFTVDEKGLITRIMTEYSGAFIKANEDYETDASVLSSCAKSNIPADPASIVASLKTVVSIQAEEKWLAEKYDEIISLLGDLYHRYDTDWNEVERLIEASRRITACSDVLEKSIESSASMEDITVSIADEWSDSVFAINAEKLLTRFHTGYDDHFRSVNDKYESDKIIVERCLRSRNAEPDPESVIDTMSAVVLYFEKQLSLSEMQKPLAAILGNDYHGIETDLNQLEEIIQNSTKVFRAKELISDAMKYASLLMSIEKEISEQWELPVLEIDTDGMLARFKVEHIGAFHKFKAAYKEDIKTLRLYHKNIGAKIDEKAIIELLTKAKQYREAKIWLAEHYDALYTVLGSRYKAEKTDWIQIKTVLQKAENIVNNLSVIRNAIDRITELKSLKESILCDYYESVFDIDAKEIRTRFKDEYSTSFYATRTDYTKDMQTLSVYSRKSGTVLEYSAVVNALQRVMDYQDRKKWFEENDKTLRSLLGDQYRGSATDWNAVRNLMVKSKDITEHISFITEVHGKYINLSALKKQILSDWTILIFDTDVKQILERFNMVYTSSFIVRRKHFLEDMDTLRHCSKKTELSFDLLNLITVLQTVSRAKSEKKWFDDHEKQLSTAFEGLYYGTETDFAAINHGLDNAAKITEAFPYFTVSEDTINALLNITDDMQLSGKARRISDTLSDEALGRIRDALYESHYICDFNDASDISASVIPQINEFLKCCTVQREYINKLSSAKRDSVLDYDRISELISCLMKMNGELSWFERHDKYLRSTFADAYTGTDTDWNELSRGLSTAEKLTVIFNGDVPDSVKMVACGGTDTQISEADVSELKRLVDETKSKINSFSAQFEAVDFSEQKLSDAATRYDACINGFDQFIRWLDYVETRAECDKHGLADFTEKIAAMDNQIVDVKDAFEKGFYTKWIEQQINKIPSIQNFRRRMHEQHLERFRKLDSYQYSIAQKRIRKRIISSYPQTDSVAKAGSDLGILRHELSKKTRHMPLRKLFQSIPELLLTLKPCLMMSPLSVAYFLDAQSYQFDMVIFDEASQIFPQDAIGAIMRGKQVIIAGDTKQLPPTSFFSASTGNNNGYDDDEGYEEEIYDSILEETANILPNRTLLWHYRSKHEHLIAFSNNQIYKNELVTFPSSNESEPDTGVEYVYVKNGYYEPSPKNYNTVEAKIIVELVKEHIEKHPKRSLGVIAFSEKQQQIISSEIQRFREANPEYESFFAEEIDDEFFVKNLENVQGDERDTIIFSIGYAKTMEQKKNNRPMAMRFGPLGLAGGERRLNVAITRAKINVKLVGSIMPSDIDLSRTKSDGVKMLRSYIEYAMNTDVALAGAAKRGRQDEFVDMIADYIRKHGYKVRQYVGCSGYRIDIAVQHPSELVEQFVAGIECDGYSYISAKTVRDRDRLRSSVLENMGWNLYRVWSVEWYKNPETEGKRLLNFIKDAIEKCDEKVKRIEELKRKEEADKKAELERLRSQRKAEELRKQSAKARPVQKPIVKKEDSLENTDLSWVRPGARVTHKRYGNGMITDFIKDKSFVKIRFSMTESLFAYPYSFKNGTISRYVNQPAVPEKQSVILAKVGEKVSHNTYGEGTVEKIENGHIDVRFGEIKRTFQYPDAFSRGFLKT